jgi:hypothetical protein
MVKRACGSLFLGAFLFAGCAAPAPGEVDPEEAVAEAPQGLLGLAECPGTVWVGRMTHAGECPFLPSSSPWSSTPMFGEDAPDELDRYCLLAWKGPGKPTPADLASLPADPTDDGHAGWYDRDCHVVAALATPTELARNAVAQSMMETFAASLEAPTSILYPAGSNVRVAIIDSHPSPTIVGRNPHGFAMGAIVSQLACPSAAGPCPVEVVPELALNVVSATEIDNHAGGYFGFQGKVATAVYSATKAWLGSSANGEDGKLILNIALGWDDRYNLNEEGLMSAAVRASRDAIEYARCHGALVLAAAGNASGCEVSEPSAGPMFPARWESFPLTCQEALGQPLVRAVGATDATGALMPSMRPGAMPRLAADGYLVPTKGTLAGVDVRHGPWSGTSVATAAVTAGAAMVWALNTNLSADQVANHLLATGIPTGASPDFCACSALPGCSCEALAVKRVSLCDAAGTAASGCWPLATKNPTWTPGQMLQVASNNNPTVTNATNLVTPIGGVCVGTVYTAGIPASPDPAELCPVEVLHNETVIPFSTPQPTVPICGACGLYMGLAPNDSTLEVGVSEGIIDPVSPATLTLHDANGVALQRYDIGSQAPVGGLLGGDVYRFQLPPINAGLARYAVIEWFRGYDGQTTSDVAIVQ